MGINDARRLVDRQVFVCWRNRKGEVLTDTVFVYQVQFVPLYGPCLVTDAGEIHLDRIESALPVSTSEAA
ncbi:MAG: hypothetical protein HYR64_03285 [Fimbriimonas ginsengisoli]|uniref:Uncharacterized protein n=1 Tax=Fimbriimonas ginsengisoli TaxID=1005039 RepID=A0A931LUK6_FIMGI|nr:hypothetical protein [Fimbriimonas ginsengisoli]